MPQLPGNKKTPHQGDQHKNKMPSKNKAQTGLGSPDYRPTRGAQSSSDGCVDQADGDQHNNISTGEDPTDPSRAILPKKKSGGASGQKTLSPIMQVMKAVTAAAINPSQKKRKILPGGPSKANDDGSRMPQKQARKEFSDGPSAEKKGKA